MRTSYRPDVDFLHGILKPNPESGLRHGRTEVLLGVWFYQHRKEWQVSCALNTRTQVSPACMRLVDVVIVDAANRETEQLTFPHLVAIEVVSAADTYMDLKARFSDLEAMGVQNIWLVDPEMRTGEVWQKGGLSVAKDNRFEAADSPILLDMGWLWEQLDEQ